MDFDLELANASLEKAQTEEVLKWALKTFPDELAMSSSFQTQSIPLLHIIANTLPQLPILFLDTGYHFPDLSGIGHGWGYRPRRCGRECIPGYTEIRPAIIKRRLRLDDHRSGNPAPSAYKRGHP